MEMYFTTTANGRSETKAIGDTFTEALLMMYIYGTMNATTVYCGTFRTQSIFYYIAYSCKNNFIKVFLMQFPKVVLTNCVVHHRQLMEVILVQKLANEGT